MRLFTAIDLPREMLERLSEFLDRVRPLANLHWSAVENLHITTKFIGEWPEERIEDVKTALRSVKSSGEIDISVRGLGWFPDARKPRVFWAGIEGGRDLQMLAESTDDALATLGILPEKREYLPHLTLARVKESVLTEKLCAAVGDPDFGQFRARAFFLYLSKNGTYSKLEEFPLIP